MSSKTFEMRKILTQVDAERDEGLTTPDDIQRFDNILYGSDPQWQMLDVYRPKSAAAKKLPVIVSIHGGAWTYGWKENYQFYCMDLAQRGFAVVNFTYRLAPEFKYPAPLEDTNHVFTWILNHSEQYGLDTEHIFAVGDSAGANILGLYASICTNPSYAAEYSFQVPKALSLKAIALHCGAYRIVLPEEGEAADATRELMAEYLPNKGTDKELQLLDVPAHVTPDYPPTFLMTCSNDFLKAEAPLLAGYLTEQNVPFVYHFYSDPQEPLFHVFHLRIRSNNAITCNNEVADFFRQYL